MTGSVTSLRARRSGGVRLSVSSLLYHDPQPGRHSEADQERLRDRFTFGPFLVGGTYLGFPFRQFLISGFRSKCLQCVRVVEGTPDWRAIFTAQSLLRSIENTIHHSCSFLFTRYRGRQDQAPGHPSAARDQRPGIPTDSMFDV